MAELEDAVRLLARLVAFDTTSRNSNRDLIRWAEAELAAHGIVSVLRPDASGAKWNLHAVIGPAVAGGIALSGHVDTVPVDGQDWRADPFALRRAHGVLRARGVCDMKGFVACMLAVAADAARTPLARPLHLLLTFDEETSFAGARQMAADMAEDAPLPAYCVVGEPSSMAPIVAHKGYASWDASAFGLTGHSSRWDATANALEMAAEAVAWLAAAARRSAAEGRRDQRFTPAHTTIHAGTLHAGTVLNIVPDRADFSFEVRGIPGDDPLTVLAALEAACERSILPPRRAAFPGARFAFAERAFALPLSLPEDHALTLLTQRLTGRNQAGHVSYGTEAGFYQGLGIPTIVCGPGDIAEAHQPEESIPEAELAACLRYLGALVETLAA
jgi:acetylornithine deacetylase